MTHATDDSQADSTVYKTLLESTKAIPWRIDWKTLQFTYIGPQIEPLLGWTPSSWVTVQDWAERMHPDDRERVVSFCVAQSQAGTDHEADYRALTRDGRQVWIRDVVHVVRDAAGEVESLVGFMFDISERKKTEQKLLELQQELESLSFKDGLTGVSNRRMFDSMLEAEWAEAQRSGQPLSLILIDIDYFKQYNDCYGHIQGDACLRQVAQALASAATRGRDGVARFGGEEFALILPGTDAASALTVAERCRDLISKAQIPHDAAPAGRRLTISLGVGTVVPTPQAAAIRFVESVDLRLYQAKQRGRNRIVSTD